jgi:hypothetical protein
MHQFARALRSVLAGGCLVLAVWAVATYFVPFSFARSWGDQHLRVGASAGRISLASHAYLGPDLAAYPPFNRSALLGGFGIDHVRSRTLSIGTSEMIDGFSDARPVRYRYRPGPPPVVVLTRGITLPGWVLCVCFAAYPFVCSTRAARRLREQQRTARGCCRYCGYDLRATPARCPECGQPKPNLAPTLHIGAA